MSDLASMTFDMLTKDNYNTWRMKAEALLDVCSLWDYVSGDKKGSSEDVVERELWKSEDKHAKSILIIHISSTLLPLVENCKTSREVWLKLEHVYGNKEKCNDSIESSVIDDENTIINDIEESVDDLLETINDSSEDDATSDKKSLSSRFTDGLFLRLKQNGVKNLPDTKIIADTVNHFIINVIRKLSNVEIKEQKDELGGRLIDNLLVKFGINPHKNDDNEAKGKTGLAETPYNTVDSRKGKENSGIQTLQDLLNSWTEAFAENEIASKDRFGFEPRYDSKEIQRNLCGQKGYENSMCPPPLLNLYTPPSTPSRRTTYKCGVCRQEGHNRTTCPLNKTVTSASKSAVKTTVTPSRSYKCGVCGVQGHNRTSCPLNKTVSPAMKSSQTTSTPPKSYKCGACGIEGHNRTSCPLNKTVSPAMKSSQTTATPPKSYKCGVCGIEGHNRTSCPLNKTVSPAMKSSQTTATPPKSYKCGVCGIEGHNRTSCPLNKTVSPALKSSQTTATPPKSYKCGACGIEGHNRRSCPSIKSDTSSSRREAISTPVRSYTCGSCGGEGHNRTSCPRNLATSNASARATYRCGTCGGEGHNSRTCGAGRCSTASLSYYTPSFSYSSPSPSYSSPSPSYSSPSPSYSSRSPSYSGGGRSYSCGNCGGSGHNRRTCSG